ncbi:MAG: division/cell wall cluster transcriptional repressor MraZ, partial [Treponemataceae bacterium]|nr:division/cell wall cluster transcriptional repressor MraZ [Treponemataceae bacterium]
MDLLIGEYRNTLDEKGRILFPSKLRAALTQDSLIIAKSLDKSLWLYTPEYWTELKTKLMENTSLFSRQGRMLRDRLLGMAQVVEFDKAGRISVPQILREYAGLTKDCVIIGVDRYVELWDAEAYRKNVEEFEPDAAAAAE